MSLILNAKCDSSWRKYSGFVYFLALELARWHTLLNINVVRCVGIYANNRRATYGMTRVAPSQAK